MNRMSRLLYIIVSLACVAAAFLTGLTVAGTPEQGFPGYIATFKVVELAEGKVNYKIDGEAFDYDCRGAAGAAMLKRIMQSNAHIGSSSNSARDCIAIINVQPTLRFENIAGLISECLMTGAGNVYLEVEGEIEAVHHPAYWDIEPVWRGHWLPHSEDIYLALLWIALDHDIQTVAQKGRLAILVKNMRDYEKTTFGNGYNMAALDEIENMTEDWSHVRKQLDAIVGKRSGTVGWTCPKRYGRVIIRVAPKVPVSEVIKAIVVCRGAGLGYDVISTSW
jgi:hypothetical protein